MRRHGDTGRRSPAEFERRHYVDFGTGNSKFTRQAILGLCHSFGWGDIVAAWCHVDCDFKSGESVQSISFNGAAAGVSLRF